VLTSRAMTSRTAPARKLAAFALLAVLPLAVQAETFRCGSRIVTTDSTAAQILKFCGQPDSQTSTTEPVRVRNPSGYVVTTGEITIEKWVYLRGSQANAMVVTIVDGKVKSIGRQR
jgi:hypothetical protein